MYFVNTSSAFTHYGRGLFFLSFSQQPAPSWGGYCKIYRLKTSLFMSGDVLVGQRVNVILILWTPDFFFVTELVTLVRGLRTNNKVLHVILYLRELREVFLLFYRAFLSEKISISSKEIGVTVEINKILVDLIIHSSLITKLINWLHLFNHYLFVIQSRI